MITDPATLGVRLSALKVQSSGCRRMIYRVASPAYARSAELANGEGALQASGRWHAKGAFRVVYGSLEPETAFAECLSHARYYNIPIHQMMPRVVAALSIRIRFTLDLLDTKVLKALDTSVEELTGLDWRKCEREGLAVPTQLLGHGAFKAHFEGVLVPSAARPGFSNLVVFPETLRGSSVITAAGLDSV